MTNPISRPGESVESPRSASLLWVCAFFLVFVGLLAGITVAGIDFFFVLAGAPSGPDDRALLSKMAVSSAQIGQAAQQAAGGDAQARSRLEQATLQVRNAIDAMSAASIMKNAAMREALARLAAEWEPIETTVRRILALEPRLVEVAASVERIKTAMPQLQNQLDLVVRAMTESGASSSHIDMTMRQVVLAGRMCGHLAQIMKGDEGTVAAVDRLARDNALFGEVLASLQQGNEEQGIARVDHAGASAALGDAAKLYERVERDVHAVVDGSADILDARDAANEVSAAAENWLASIRRTEAMLAEGIRSDATVAWANAIAATLLSLLLLVAMACLWPLRKRSA